MPLWASGYRNLLPNRRRMMEAGASSGLPSYYVDATGGNDANTGLSPTEAWQTIAKVNAATFNPGESVLFKRGETWSGTQLTLDNDSITIDAYASGVNPILENPGVYGSGTRTIVIQGDDITVQNLTLQDCADNAILLDDATMPDNIVIQDCEITDTGSGVRINGTAVKITRCNIHDLNIIVDDVAAGNDFGAVGVWCFRGTDIEISYCTFDSLRAASTDYGFDGGAIEFYVPNNTTVSGVRVHHNYIVDCQGFFEVGGEGTNSFVDDVIFYQNRIINSRFMIFNNAGGFATPTSNFRVEHNTFVQTDPDTDLFGHDVFIFSAAPGAGELNARDNIFYVRERDITSHDGFTHSYNTYFVYDGSNVVLALGTGEQVEIPRFTDIATEDLTLAVTSPAVDAGTDLGYASDYNDAPMPVNGTPDQGAYENQTGYSAPVISYIVDIDHEAGNLNEYDATAGGVSATVGAALNGTSYGLNVNITDVVADYGQVNLSLPGSGITRHRIYIDPNGLTMAAGDDFVFLQDDLALIYWRLHHDGADYFLRIAGDDDGGTWPVWFEIEITDAPHLLEVMYTRASDAVAADGRVQVWLDDIYQGEMYLDNFDKWALTSWLRIGAVDAIDVGTSGNFFLDEWKVNDDGYRIGNS